MHRSLALSEARYYWPHKGDDVETFVKTFIVCQKDNMELKSLANLLQHFPIPECSWDSVPIDFIIGLRVSLLWLKNFPSTNPSFQQPRSALLRRQLIYFLDMW